MANLLKFICVIVALLSVAVLIQYLTQGKVLVFEISSDKNGGLWQPPTTVQPFTGSTKNRLWTPSRPKDGLWTTERFDLTEQPQTEDPRTEDPRTEDPRTENPQTEDPRTERPTSPSDEEHATTSRRTMATRPGGGLPWLPTREPNYFKSFKPAPVQGESVVDGLKFPPNPLKGLLRNKRSATVLHDDLKADNVNDLNLAPKWPWRPRSTTTDRPNNRHWTGTFSSATSQRSFDATGGLSRFGLGEDAAPPRNRSRSRPQNRSRPQRQRTTPKRALSETIQRSDQPPLRFHPLPPDCRWRPSA